mmetsp:Transcript_15625/g.30034  ORF Transcript_15625/g.30034 Transcript_15625/m.30034 type:complete len:272 (-) Transcript_15625:452-1267(-)
MVPLLHLLAPRSNLLLLPAAAHVLVLLPDLDVVVNLPHPRLQLLLALAVLLLDGLLVLACVLCQALGLLLHALPPRQVQLAGPLHVQLPRPLLVVNLGILAALDVLDPVLQLELRTTHLPHVAAHLLLAAPVRLRRLLLLLSPNFVPLLFAHGQFPVGVAHVGGVEAQHLQLARRQLLVQVLGVPLQTSALGTRHAEIVLLDAVAVKIGVGVEHGYPRGGGGEVLARRGPHEARVEGATRARVVHAPPRRRFRTRLGWGGRQGSRKRFLSW